MSQALAPCPSCSRHVNISEQSCPFCKSVLPQGMTAIPGATQRLGRAAAFAFTASLAVAGCTAGSSLGLDGGTEPGRPDGSTPDGSTNDGSTTDAGTKKDGSTPVDDGGAQPPYGAPAYGGPGFDAGM